MSAAVHEKWKTLMPTATLREPALERHACWCRTGLTPA